MQYFLTLMGVAGMLFGLNAFAYSGQTNSAIHEIEGLISFLVAAVGFGLGSILHRLKGILNVQHAMYAPPPPPPPRA